MSTIYFIITLSTLVLVLQFFIIKQNKNLMTKQEFTDAINVVSDTLQKALNEVVAAVGASGNSTPEMDAALTRLQAAAKALDDLNPDA
jgi:hypothetical protein